MIYSAKCSICGATVTSNIGWKAHEHPEATIKQLERAMFHGFLDLSDPTSVERLAAVLEAEGFVRGVARRYGTSNAPYWEQSATAIIDALREPLP